jgi:integrase
VREVHRSQGAANVTVRNIVTSLRVIAEVDWQVPVLSPEEVKRVLAMATSLKARAMLTLSYGCGLRASEVARLRAGDIDSEQMIIRIVQSKGSLSKGKPVLSAYWRAHFAG